MTRPVRTTKSFLMRVKMARRIGLFLIIEGKKTEPWFYEQVCKRSELIRNVRYSIVPVQTIAGHGSSAGGKTRVLELFKETRHSGLKHRTRGHTAAVMFCVDADHDRVTRKMLRSEHLTYTALPDIEAHMFDDFDTVAAICQVHSATSVHSSIIGADFRRWRESISQSWREWFELCLTAHYCGIRDPSPGTPPKTIANGCAPDLGRLADLKHKIISEVGISNYEDRRSRANDRIETFFRTKGGIQLLKGKWLAPQLHSLGNSFAVKNGLPKAKSSDVTLEAVKGHSRFTQKTTRYFHQRFEALLV